MNVMGKVNVSAWIDLNPNSEFNDPPETRVEGVKVILFESSTNRETQYMCITDQNGKCMITGVKPGKYYPIYKAPKGYGFQTLQNFVDENGRGREITVLSGKTSRSFAPLKGLPIIELTKTVNLLTANIGDELIYTINVSNEGLARANNIRVIDIIPVETTFLSDSVMVDGAPRLGDNPAMGILLGNIESNKEKIVTFKVKVNENLTEGTIIRNIATVRFNGKDERSNEVITNIKISFIKGIVWNDLNGNGIREGNEQGIKDVKVDLYLSNNLSTVIKSVQTDLNGNYLFNNLKSGEYRVKFNSIRNWVFTKENIGINKQLNSKVNRDTGFTDNIKLSGGNSDETVNAGIIKLVTIRGKAWLDSNRNGILDSGEIGVANVTLTLFECNTLNVTTFKAITNSTGDFFIERVRPGVYHGVFTKPEGYDFVTIGSIVDTMGKTPCFTVESGINIMNFNVPLINIINVIASKEVNTREVQIGDTLVYKIKIFNFGVLPINNINISDIIPSQLIFIDNSLKINGQVQRGRNPSTGVPLNNIAGNESATIEFQTKVSNGISLSDKIINRAKVLFDGNSIFTNTIEVEIKKSSIEGFVWEDLNGDGIKNGNDSFLSNIRVNLYEGNNLDEAINTTITNIRGQYIFNNLKSGEYIVEIVNPKGSIFTKKNSNGLQVNIEINSLVNVESGRSDKINLNIDENIRNIDAGIIKELTIKGVVWEDLNENKEFDREELGIKGVKVEVFDCNERKNTEYNGITNEIGEYEIKFFQPGRYNLIFFKPENYKFLKIENFDVLTGKTECFEIQSSQTKIKNIPLKKEKEKEIECISCIGGIIKDKCTNCGVSNVKVFLVTPNKKILWTETNSDGKYYFKVNLPGIYEVEFGSVCGYYLTPRKLSIKVKCVQCLCNVNALVCLRERK